MTITFQGALAQTNVPLMTANSGGLTGGSSPTVTPTETTPGRSGHRFVTFDIPGAWSAYGLNGEDSETRVYELEMSYVYDAVNSFGFQVRAQNNRTSAF